MATLGKALPSLYTSRARREKGPEKRKLISAGEK